MSLLVSKSQLLVRQPYHVAAALLLTVTALVYYLPFLHELPVGIHGWAQADRLALAINFYDYGFHFLTPRTSSLTSINGVTGVEFPFQAYVAALGGLVVGRSNIPAVFRALDIAMTVLGFFYMFRLVFERTGHFVAGLVPGAFLLASPFFAFYAGSFMPDPFSLSLSFIAYFYWFRFFEQRHFIDLRRALLLLALAGLIKTTTALLFGAVVGITLLWAYLNPTLLLPRQRWLLLAWAALGFGVIAYFFLHNRHLNELYLSDQFRATPNPVQDPEAWHDLKTMVRQNWLYEYGTKTHYRMLAACLVLLLVFVRHTIQRYWPLLVLLVAAVGVTVAFVLIMGNGLSVHDYHWICSFIPPVLLLLLLALLNLGRYTGWMRYATSAGLGILIIHLGVMGYQRLQRRMSDDYPPFSQFYSYRWMRGGAAEMQQVGVPATAQALFINLSVNVPQIYFDRRGVAWQPDNIAALTIDELLTHMAADSLDYLVLSPADYQTLAPQQSALAAAFETVGRHPAFILRRRNREYPW